MRVPGGDASCLGLGRPGSGALPPPTSRPFGRAAGSHYPLAVVAGVAGVGTRHQPHSARSYELALRFVGAACGCPGGAPLVWLWGVRGLALSQPRPLVLLGVRPGPTTHLLWVREVRAWGPVTNPTARTLACWRCALWGRHEGARGARLLPGCGASGDGRSPTPDLLSFPACSRGPLPAGCGCGGCGCGDPAPTPQRAPLRAGFARCGGDTWAPGGGASCLGVGRPATGALTPPISRLFGRAARARFPLAVGAVCGRGGPAVLGILSRAAVRHVLCALPGFAARGGRSDLAPVLVPWLRPAACLSGVPCDLVLVRRSSSGPVALSALVGSPVAVVPSPTPGAVAPGFTGWLRGARGGRPGTGLFVPAAGPCRGKGAGRAPRRTRSGPRDGVVPGGSLRLRSWAACAAVVWRVSTRSLTRPVSRTVRLSMGDLAGAPGLVCVDADTAPFGSVDATPRSRACVRVRALLGQVGRAGLPGAFRCASPFLWPVLVRALLVRPPPGLGCPVCGCCWVSFFFFFCFFPSPPSLRPRCLLLCVFSGPGCLGLWRLVAPCPPVAPCCLLLCVFSGLGCLGPWRLAAAPPFPLLPPRVALRRLLLCVFSGLPWVFAPCHPPPFFFPLFLVFSLSVCFSSSFFAGGAVRGGFMCLGPSAVLVCASVVLSLSLRCVRWMVLCGVGCWAWLSSAVSWWVLVSCFGGAVLVWPRGSPRCSLAWCALVFCCPVLCSAALWCCVVVCCRALPFVCAVACACCLFLAAARLLCMFWGVVLCAPCSLRPVRCCAALCWCPFVVLCASPVLCLVAVVAGSWSRCLFGVSWWLWLPGVVVWWCVSALVPVSGLAVARCLPCVVLLPCVVSCGVVVPCGAVLWCPVFFFLFFSLLVALVSCCSLLVLSFGPFPGRFCFCALPVRCCAGVPASLPSVRCSLALAGRAGVLCCCLLCLCVCCLAWLPSVVSWSVLVAPGVVSRWRAVVLRVGPPGVALLCAVLFRFASFGAAARCVVSWGAVRRLGVLCLLTPCFVLSPPRRVRFAVVCRCVVLFAVVLCAVCALGCRVVCFLSSPPCAVLLCGPLSLGALLPCAVPHGAVLPRGAVVSCPATLLGLFLAWVWLYLLAKPLHNFLKYFFSSFFGFCK